MQHDIYVDVLRTEVRATQAVKPNYFSCSLPNSFPISMRAWFGDKRWRFI
ncbi:MAG: hypothetical protein L6Q53_12670 [Candidatus Brocadia sinica]|nr:hypothetical protein [Candidatus Brocadia sinica]NUO04676.1 hypothetical protein [Candidatus Brocadia sinica]